MALQPPQPPVPAAPNSGAQNGMGIAALVLGIVSLVTCWGGLIPAILAIVFGRIGMTRADQGLATNRGMAKAGFILGIIGAAIWGVVIVFAVIGGMLDAMMSGY